jgi:hypothetical protein
MAGAKSQLTDSFVFPKLGSVCGHTPRVSGNTLLYRGIKHTQAQLLLGLFGPCLWKSSEKKLGWHCLPTLATQPAPEFSTVLLHKLNGSQRGSKIVIATEAVCD